MIKRFIRYLYYRFNCYVGDSLNDYARYVVLWALPKNVDIIAFKLELERIHNSEMKMPKMKFIPLCKKVNGEVIDLVTPPKKNEN